jgi:glutathione-independent formaldehyde dehydrogenase
MVPESGHRPSHDHEGTEESTMRAVVYEGPNQVQVKDVPDARIERPTDVLVRITTTNICGSDLHMYEGRTDFEPGRWFGHENMGEVIEVGDGVDKVKVGDRVVLPFNVACGHCKNCERGLTNYCLTAQPVAEWAGAAYGFADMGPWAGGQAELLRVPWGDFNCLRLGEDADERASDYVMLADIWPTGYHATELAGVSPGDQTVIFGSGPVGLMAALSATIRGASKVMVVDRHPDRLRLAESIGAIPIDDSKVDPVEAVLEETMGLGADNGCECVGYQAHDPEGNEHPNDTLNKLVRSVRFTGRIGSIGVFVPQDPGGVDELAKKGQVAFDYGMYWFKGQHIGSGQAPVKRYNRQLRDLIAADKAHPSFIVSHELPLSRAPEAYEHFDARDEGWTKVVLKPALAA